MIEQENKELREQRRQDYFERQRRYLAEYKK